MLGTEDEMFVFHVLSENMYKIRHVRHFRRPWDHFRALTTDIEEIVPKHVLTLIHDCQSYAVHWPRPFALGALARNWDPLGSSLDDMEDHLLALTPPVNGSYVSSRSLLNGWVMAPNLDSIERMEKAVININNQRSGPHQRIAYVFLILRYCLLLDKVFQVPNNTQLILMIHQWCDASQNIDYRNFHYFLWRYLHASDDPPHVLDTQKYVTKGIKREFAKECLFYAWQRTKPVIPLNHCSKLFDFEPLDVFCERMDSNSQNSDFYAYLSLMIKSLFHWSEGRYSESLSNLATVTEALSSTIFSKSDRVELTRALIVSLTKITRDSKEHDMALVDEFLDLAAEKIYKTTGCPLLIALIWTFTSCPQKSRDIKNSFLEIKSMSSILQQIRQITESPYFMYSQRSLDGLSNLAYKLDSINPVSVGEKNFVLDNKLIDQLAPNNIAHQIHNQTIPMTPELLREVTDIKVLEALAMNKIEAAVMLTVKEYHQQREISSEVLEKVLERINPISNQDLFKQLKEAVPLKSEAAVLVFATEIEFRLKSNFDVWKHGKYFEAIDLNLKLYRMLLDEEYHLEKEPLQRFLKDVRNFIQYFTEKSTQMRLGENILDFVENECVIIGQTYNDYSLAVVFWEVMFFGNYFQYQRRADDLFMEHKAIQNHWNIKRVLNKANKLEDEEIFRRILETCLRHDVEVEQKTQAFEGLLKHQCKRGYMKRTLATLQSAMDLGIPIGDDIKNIINKTHTEFKASESRGVMAAFKDLWKGGTSSK
eukprot:TCALIF_02279-PA protein Name:"Protein of unknown function" AED:0.00 eAED:0.00 QI:0/1/1/1/1/1/3/28/763